ncbi:thioesterase family protein [Marinobacter salexigens]|uniref:thioesterase family protein n=1 Tax=Marinobacter salexigens TaxID=1925763 RepID=UPI000C287569|nr:thioesterase family protein [Marinobacter salexigens]
MDKALFQRDGDFFVPTPSSRSPWSPQHLHGGPVVGLMAHAMEKATNNERLNLARLTVDLLRPVPDAPLTVNTRLVRGGSRLQILEASLLAGDTKVARASALFLETSEQEVPDYGHFGPSEHRPPVEPVEQNISEAAGWTNQYSPEGLHSTAKAKLIDGVKAKGQGIAWMRLPVPVVEDVEASPDVMAAALCDFGNGVGQLSLGGGVGCINADATLYLHRRPVGEWLGLDARSRMQDSGIGLVETTLFDGQGPVGKVLQAIIPMRMPGAEG